MRFKKQLYYLILINDLVKDYSLDRLKVEDIAKAYKKANPSDRIEILIVKSEGIYTIWS